MPLTDAFANELWQLLFNAVAIANLANNATSAPLTSLWLSLHNADPGVAGDQSTFETAYTDYERVAVVRDATGWTVVGGRASNTDDGEFPQCTGGSDTITHVGFGTAQTGAGRLLLIGELAVPIAVSTGVTPTFAADNISATIT